MADLEKNITKPKKELCGRKCRDRLDCISGCVVIWCIILCLSGLIIGSVGAGMYDHNIKIFVDPVATNCTVKGSEIITEICPCKSDSACQKSCFTISWNVDLHHTTWDRDGYIIEARKDTYDEALHRKNQFQVNSTYPCWYEHDDPAKIRWSGSSTYMGKLLLMIGWPMFGCAILIGCLVVCIS